MQTLIWLILGLGLTPLIIGIWRLEPARPHGHRLPPLGSVILCALAFNLTFFWQELWLVIPKAITPGLSPTLYHNDHDWTGSAPIAELLQGTGAVATLASGIGALWFLRTSQHLSASWRVFVFWMAFQGLFQALSQFAVGTMIPGNDVGRALAYLGAGDMMKFSLLIVSVAGMWGAGAALARHTPLGILSSGQAGTRSFATSLFVTALFCVVLSIAFRAPRSAIELIGIPLIVNLIGIGWLTLGASFVSNCVNSDDIEMVDVYRPIAALAILLLMFQIILRPGIGF